MIAGVLLVFVPALGEFIIPDLLGGSDTLMIGKVMWSEFFSNRDWPLAAALAMMLLLLLALPLAVLRMLEDRRETA
jgi:putrescine transport system permease protein